MDVRFLSNVVADRKGHGTLMSSIAGTKHAQDYSFLSGRQAIGAGGDDLYSTAARWDVLPVVIIKAG